MTTPVLNVVVSSSLNSVLLPSGNSRLPLPRTMGLTQNRYSSIRSCCMSVCMSSPLPYIRMSRPGCCFSLATSLGTSSRITLVLFHSTASSVVETTNLGRLFIRSANSPSRDGGADGRGHLQPAGERLAGRGQQRGADIGGELPSDAHRTAEGVAGGRRGLAGDAGREAAGQVGAVGGHADAAKDRDAERAAELAAGLRDARGRPGPLERRRGHDQVGRAGEQIGRASCRERV